MWNRDSEMTAAVILVIGGYGGTGSRICQRLLRETGAKVVVGGRTLKKAEELRDSLNSQFSGERVSAVHVDASNRQSLILAFQGASLVIDASIAVSHVHTVATAAIDAGIDYLDIHFEQKTVPVLEALAPRIQAAGRCFISQAGFHPGLPAAFIRHAAPDFEEYDSAVIGMAMNQKIEKPESVYEIVDMLDGYKADIFKNGAWKAAGPFDVKKIGFGPRFGIRTCYPLQMAEIYAMPGMFGLKETGVYVAGFNWFVDQIVFPLGMLLFKIKRGLGRDVIARLLLWGMDRFNSGGPGVSFVLEATGSRNGKPVCTRLVAEHDDAYEFTAIPVAACVRQYLDGTIAAPGLWMMGQVADPGKLLSDLERMGIQIAKG
jgi:saccharopine dehydrogenase-like NADP-dependent oxidoreductase